MTIAAIALFVLLALILRAMWRRASDRSFDELLNAAHHEHEQVRHLHEAMPRGERWSIVKPWLEEDGPSGSGRSD